MNIRKSITSILIALALAVCVFCIIAFYTKKQEEYIGKLNTVDRMLPKCFSQDGESHIPQRSFEEKVKNYELDYADLFEQTKLQVFISEDKSTLINQGAVQGKSSKRLANYSYHFKSIEGLNTSRIEEVCTDGFILTAERSADYYSRGNATIVCFNDAAPDGFSVDFSTPIAKGKVLTQRVILSSGNFSYSYCPSNLIEEKAKGIKGLSTIVAFESSFYTAGKRIEQKITKQDFVNLLNNYINTAADKSEITTERVKNKNLEAQKTMSTWE
ncbi:hypothetical protein QTV49_004669 [Vibrio vulnificus]|nr:hypothetical protein [Vibrio vulnificus]